MTIFLCVVVLLQLYMISTRDKRIEALQQENAYLRKKLHWKNAFASDLEDE